MKICSDFFSVIGAYVNLHIFSSAIFQNSPYLFPFSHDTQQIQQEKKRKKK